MPAISATALGVARLYGWLCSAIVPCFLLSDFEAGSSWDNSVGLGQTLLLSSGSAALVALLVLPAVWLGGWMLQRAFSSVASSRVALLVGGLAFVSVSAAAWFLLWPDIRQSLHPDRAMCLLAGAAAAVIGYVALRARGGGARTARFAQLFLALLVALLAGLGVALDQRKYIELHDLGELLLVIALAAVQSFWFFGHALLVPGPGARARWAAAGLVPLFAALVSAPHWDRADAAWRAAGAQSNRLARRLSALSVLLRDRDGDGHSPWLYPGDCDDRDARRHPGAAELEPARDANCNGHERTAASEGPFAARAAPAPGSGPIGDVLLLSIDAFVPAALSSMPALRELAATGLQLERCYAAGTATALALPLFFRADDRSPPVTDQLRAQQIRVHAWLDHVSFPDIPGARRVDSSERAIRNFLATLAEPEPGLRFTWLHLFDLHEPNESATVAGGAAAGSGISPEYAAAARRLDNKLAELLGELRRSERGRATRVVVTGDHGEAFGEHGFTAHGFSGYEEVVRTPCFVAGGGVRPKVYTGVMSHRGLPATLLDLFGMSGAAAGAQRLGVSWLRAHGDSVALPERALIRSMRYASGGIGHSPLAIAISGRHKLVSGLHDGSLELYDLAHDPGEKRNLASENPGELARLGAELAELVDLDAFPSPASFNYRNYLFRVVPR